MTGKKFLRLFLILLGLLVIVAVILFFWLDRPIPEYRKGPEARQLAHQMSAVLHEQAWDSTAWVTWTFPGGHHYIWHKPSGWVRVKWGNHSVMLQTHQRSASRVSDTSLTGEEAQALIEKAWKHFCNDSYWLIAPYKWDDPGVQLGWVDTHRLLVQYTAGGVTPGDTYVWTLDKNGRPISFRMWVSIIPIGGLQATWEQWDTTHTGAVIATQRSLAGIVDLQIKDLATGFTPQDIGLAQNPFKEVLP